LARILDPRSLIPTPSRFAALIALNVAGASATFSMFIVSIA
jgi:hypothetical protein